MRKAIAAVVLWLVSPPAFAATIFDFDDFPDSSRCNPPVDAPTCQQFLQLIQSGNLGNEENRIPVFTTVDGVRIDVFQAVPAGFEWQNGVLASLGNIPSSTALSIGFSKPLESAKIDLKVLSMSQGDVDFVEDPTVFLEGYDASGALLARVEATAVVDVYSTLSITAPSGRAFRSIRFAGGGRARIPEWFGDDVVDVENNSAADNLEVQPVPEPSGAAVFAAGLGAILWIVRRRGAPRPAPARSRDREWWKARASKSAPRGFQPTRLRA
jgi:hypothetical protein